MVQAERPVTVLNVNDDAATRYVMSNILRKGGYVVLEAACGEDALRIVALERPDLVLLDIRLPDISGLEVCRRIKADPELRSTLVMQTSATFASTERKVEGLDSGADAYLVQPIERIELLASVRAMLRTKRAEAGERRAGRLLERTFEAMRDAVVIVDTAGIIEQCNSAAARLLGSRAGHELRVNGPAGPSGAEIVGRMIAAGSDHFERETTFDGRTYRMRADPLRDDAGGIEGAVILFHDISISKRLEESQRARADELAEDGRRKDEFLGMLAHELRNPLNAIASAATLLSRGATDEPARLHDVIHRQVRNLARLVDDLLEVSRITRGQLQLRRAPLDLAAVVRRAVEAIRPEFEARHQQLSLSLPPNSVIVLGDDLRLEQVLMNLLANASKYSEARGRTELELVVQPGEQLATLRVRDDGIGLPPEMLAKVFEPFVQVDQSLSRTLGGLGIGLTMVRSLVDLHGGTVRAASGGLGKGSVFEVELPLAPGMALAEAPPSAPRPEQDGTLSVLVVEDNEDTLELVQMLIESMGHSVQAANDGNAGLKIALSLKPDVALVDIGLPGIDGYELAKRLRGVDVDRSIFLVAVTGYGRPEDKARALDAGFDHYVVKPIDLAAISAALDMSRRAAERGRSMLH